MMTYEKIREVNASFTRQLLETTPCLSSLAERLEAAATTEVPVLLTGETGTGKTYLARLIHNYSPRCDHRLVVVPCGALAPSLLMSELFGQTGDASQGPGRLRIGRFETAGSGTLLLDEIDALPLPAQAAVLRGVETGNYQPIGSKETRFCKARIVAASNGDLGQAVIEKRFRSDLYRRLDEFSIYLPPLRRRQADIAPLARAMLVRSANKFRKKPPAIHAETLRVLQSFRWPGNIRQLENCIQQAVLMSSGNELRVEHLPEAIRAPTNAPAPHSPHRGPGPR